MEGCLPFKGIRSVIHSEKVRKQKRVFRERGYPWEKKTKRGKQTEQRSRDKSREKEIDVRQIQLKSKSQRGRRKIVYKKRMGVKWKQTGKKISRLEVTIKRERNKQIVKHRES